MEVGAEGIADLENVSEPSRAAALLHPLRARLLSLAREPASATELAKHLGLPRQRVNYHVRALEDAGFLKPAGKRRRRNLIEQRYVATARSYVLSPHLLGPLGADWRAIERTASADYVLALAEQVRSDLTRSSGGKREEGTELDTVSVKAQFRFETPRQRAGFARAVREALVDVIARHSSPQLENGKPGRGQSYRLVLSCYPVAAGAAAGEGSKGGRA